MAKEKDDIQFSEAETAKRRDDALLRALSTSHKPHSEMKLGKSKTKAEPAASLKKSERPPKAKSLGPYLKDD